MAVDKLQAIIQEASYDAILLTGVENPAAAKNLRYITGYTGSYGFAIVGPDYKYFVSDFRYRDQVAEQVPDFTFKEITKGYLSVLLEIVEAHDIQSLGFDKRIRYSEYEQYEKLGCELIPLDGVLESLRVSKTADEVAKIKKACEITDQALADILEKIQVGMTEKEVEVQLKNRMIELGADNTWDRFIVASGPRGAMPHGMASDKVIQKGEMVTFDIGCSYQGYYSDLTRTVAMGEPSDKMKELYDIVKDAQQTCVDAAKAGITGRALDKVARDIIEAAGYGDHYKHGTGHGLGLDVHEEPRVSAANDKPLELGACVTIEPGIYISGLGGVRIEDDVILTEDGCIVLNEFTKELLIIE